MALIKEIEFVFENCETCTVKENAIGDFEISGIETINRRVACNAIDKYQVAKHVKMELFHEGEFALHSFDEPECDSKKVIERIMKYNDITSVCVTFDNGSAEEYLVDYDTGEDEEELGAANLNQHTYLSRLGNLYLVIDKDTFVEQCFDMVDINDEEQMNLKKDLLDIGIKDEPEHPYNEDSLPDFYRYVYLNDATKGSLAMRVPDPDCCWKFVFDKESEPVHFPKTWQYVRSNICTMLDKEDTKLSQIRAEHFAKASAKQDKMRRKESEAHDA